MSETSALASHLADQVGARRPTSREEATAAAYVNGRLRAAGMRVSTRRIEGVVQQPGLSGALASALAGLASLAAIWLPLPGLVQALIALALLVYAALIATLPALGRRGESQTIVGTREVRGSGGLTPRRVRWRLVLLAPLDTPLAWPGLRRLAAPTRLATIARLLAALLVVLLAIAQLSAPALPWRWLQFGPAIYLLLATLGALLPSILIKPDGGAGALATLYSVACHLPALNHVELWTIALGAAGSDARGLHSLLADYPFEPERTLFIALEHIDGGQLVYATRVGALRQRSGGSRLLAAAAAADAADPLIDAEPRPYALDSALTAPLYANGYAALTLFSSDASPGQTTVDPQLVERAARLIVGIARQFEGMSSQGENFEG